MSKDKGKTSEPKKPGSPRIANRRGRHEYHILEVLECGIQLTGTEVKSLRAGQAKIDEAYAKISGNQLWLVGSNIAQYPQAAPSMQHEPGRERRLLIHRRQIADLQIHVKQKGKTLIPLAMYFKGGWAKVEIAIAIGKKQFDKRQDLKKKQADRDIGREMGRRRRGM